MATELLRSDIAVEGMTCASCAARIQRSLADLDGVDDALVNFANGRAVVMHDGRADDRRFRETIEQLGYQAPYEPDHDGAERRREEDLRRRLVVAVVLGVPVTLISMVPGLRFTGWEWVVAALATPVVFWCGWTFHRATWMNLRHGSTTMDTLVSMGTLAAWTWSTVVLLGGDDGMHLYYETAAVIVALILLGQAPPVLALPGMAAVVAGVALVVRASRPTTLVEPAT